MLLTCNTIASGNIQRYCKLPTCGSRQTRGPFANGNVNILQSYTDRNNNTDKLGELYGLPRFRSIIQNHCG